MSYHYRPEIPPHQDQPNPKALQPRCYPLILTFPAIARADIRRAYEQLNGQYPPVLNLQQAAAIANLAPGTLKRKVSEGCFKNSVKRGKPLLFWRDQFVQELML